MAHVRVILRLTDANARNVIAVFPDAQARIVNRVLQVYRSESASGSGEEIVAEFPDAAYLHWIYFD
jgi:hypothetical protein